MAEATSNEYAEGAAEASDPTMPRAVDAAYRGIRRAIISGDLRSGEKVSESALAERLGVSRTPVREALNRLRNEGLIVLERYRKGYVANFTADDLREIFRLRATLEGEAARGAALRIGDEDLARMEALQDEMERSYEAVGYDESVETFDRLNREFHRIVARAAGIRRLDLILEGALELPAAGFVDREEYFGTVDERMVLVHQQHRQVIAALKSRNPDWAQSAMAAHLYALCPPKQESLPG